jgi:hypothetical protein
VVHRVHCVYAKSKSNPPIATIYSRTNTTPLQLLLYRLTFHPEAKDPSNYETQSSSICHRKIIDSWVGHYVFNIFDHGAIIAPHTEFFDLMCCVRFFRLRELKALAYHGNYHSRIVSDHRNNNQSIFSSDYEIASIFRA